jgi:two-component system, OmpR family, response regulator
MQTSPHILIVDDDPEIRRLLSRYLDGQGFNASLADSAREMRERLKTSQLDLIVLDVMLPDASGLDLCRELRSTHPQIPVILLTALKEDVDRIIGLEIGADDYLGKPFNPRELVARIRAVLRRATDDPPPPLPVRYRFGGLVADPATRDVVGEGGAKVPLTSAEFDVLRAFLERPGRVLSREQILDLGRRKRGDPLDRSIDVLISRIRHKLEDAGAPDAIKTIRNGGYQFTLRVETEGTPP